MTTICLHIGMPKTGTTLIQNVLVRVRDDLVVTNIWTPKHSIDSHRVAVEASPDEPLYRDRPDYKRLFELGDSTIFDQMKAAAACGHDILLSSEYFSDCTAKDVRRLFDNLIPGAQYRIIVYLRRQDRYIESNHNQIVKASGGTARLIWNPKDDARYHWERRVGEWGDCFGDESIDVLIFDDLILAKEKRAFSASILDLMGVRIADSVLRTFEAGNDAFQNRSLKAELLEFRRLANTVSQIGELDWLIERAEKLNVGKTPFSIGPDLSRQIVAHYEHSNAVVAKRFLGRPRLFDEHFEDTIDSSEMPVDTETLALLVVILAKEISALRSKPA